MSKYLLSTDDRKIMSKKCFNFSFIRDQNNLGGNVASCYYPMMHLLKYDERLEVRLEVL